MATTSDRPGIFAVRDVRSLITETAEEGHGLKKAVGVTQLTAMGVGAIIGTGIFVVIGKGAGIAGPAVILSFVLADVPCPFSALSYADLASSIPLSGSAYTYSYATLGELGAWIIGWDLIIEYAVGNIAVAISWAAYFRQLMMGLGIHIAAWLSTFSRWTTLAITARVDAGVDPTKPELAAAALS